MSGLGNNSTTTTSTAAPWSGAQPYLTNVLSEAKKLYQTGEGFNPYPGNTVVPYSPQSLQAMSGIENLANQGNPMAQAAQQQAMGILGSGGMSDWQKQALEGTYGVATGGNQLDAISGNLGATAAGEYLGGRNPYFQENLDREAGKLATDVSRNVDLLGRRGSGYAANEIGDVVGNFRNQAMQQNYDQERQLQMQAAGMLSGEQQGNIANLMGAGQSIFGAGDTAAGRAAQYAGLAPSIYQDQYAPAERLASVGAQQEDLATRQMQDLISRYYGEQQAPWNALSNYGALVSGAGQFGSTGSQTVTPPANYAAPLGGALGGAQLGSMFGPWGTGIGALLGGGLGVLGI